METTFSGTQKIETQLRLPCHLGSSLIVFLSLSKTLGPLLLVDELVDSTISKFWKDNYVSLLLISSDTNNYDGKFKIQSIDVMLEFQNLINQLLVILWYHKLVAVNHDFHEQKRNAVHFSRSNLYRRCHKHINKFCNTSNDIVFPYHQPCDVNTNNWSTKKLKINDVEVIVCGKLMFEHINYALCRMNIQSKEKNQWYSLLVDSIQGKGEEMINNRVAKSIFAKIMRID